MLPLSTTSSRKRPQAPQKLPHHKEGEAPTTLANSYIE